MGLVGEVRQNTPMESTTCENCHYPREGSYCPQCGQNNRNYQRSIVPMLGDLIRETFDVDARVFKTLKLLLFVPGELAAEFSRNRRARYVNPLRLYLFISVIFFLLLSWLTEPQFPFANAVDPESFEENIEDPIDNEDILALRQVLSAERFERAAELIEKPDGPLQKQILLKIDELLDNNDEPLSAAERFGIGQLIDAIADPRMMMNNFLDNLPFAMFFLLPMFALILQLIYFRCHKYYVEHLVFATHLHSFTFLIYTVLLLTPAEVNRPWLQSIIDLSGSILLTCLAIYHIIALKRYYAQSWLNSCLKFTAQMMIYGLFLLPTSAVAVILLSFATL